MVRRPEATMLDFSYSRKFGHSRKLGAAIVGAVIMLVGSYVSCHAQTGSVHLSVVKAGFIVSTGSGTGTLNYQGRTYRLSVSTVGYGTIGVTGGELTGTAYNLRTAADIAGTYTAPAAGLRSAAARGWRGFRMQTVSSWNWLEHSLVWRYPSVRLG